jgi:hypothetical protein
MQIVARINGHTEREIQGRGAAATRARRKISILAPHFTRSGVAGTEEQYAIVVCVSHCKDKSQEQRI